VWLARDAIGTHHAVKIVYGQPQRRSSALEREFNGIRSFTPISRSHPGLVHILHVGRNDTAGYIYCIMELGDDMVDGQKIEPATYTARTFSRVLKREGPLPLEQVLRIGIQLCQALDHLHSRRLIHRDIKPSNIIFVGGIPKFADIGLVTEVVEDQREVTALGTPGRMAPEGPDRPAADVFSLGKILYEAGFNMEVSRYPELPEEFLRMRERTPLTELNRIILKACEAEESRRYQRASELQADLERLLGEILHASTPWPGGAA
jgi:serine/threonine protein kinase